MSSNNYVHNRLLSVSYFVHLTFQIAVYTRLAPRLRPTYVNANYSCAYQIPSFWTTHTEQKYSRKTFNYLCTFSCLVVNISHYLFSSIHKLTGSLYMCYQKWLQPTDAETANTNAVLLTYSSYFRFQISTTILHWRITFNVLWMNSFSPLSSKVTWIN